MNKRDLKKFKTILETKRDAIVNASGKKTHWENMENTRHGDFVDQASDDNEVHVNIRLLQTDAKLLRAIEAAISRIENGTFDFGIFRYIKRYVEEKRAIFVFDRYSTF